MRIQIFDNLFNFVIFLLLQFLSTSSLPTTSTPPVLLWTQQFGKWSKFRGITGQPRDWINKATKYAHSEPEEKTNYWSLDHNRRTDAIYWTDQLNPGVIFEQKAADSLNWVKASVNVHQIDSTEIDHFTVDWATDNIYFIHSVNKTIAVVAKVKGQTTVKVLHFDLENPASITCDSVKGLLFWTDDSMSSPVIESSSLNGEDRKVLLSTPIVVRPAALTTLENGGSQLIWVDEGLRHVMSCQYDGSNARILFNYDSGRLFKGIAAFDEFIFLTDEFTLSVDIISVQSGTLMQQIDVDAHPNDIVIIQVGDPNFRHDCDSKPCEYFCFNVGNSKGECGCPNGYYLSLDGVSCKASETRFIFSTPDRLIMAVPNTDIPLAATTGSLNVSLSSLTNASINASYLGVHFATRTVFWADKPTGSLYSIRDLSKNPPKTDFGDVQEITVQQTSIEGVAVHWLDSLLLWIDGSLNHIMGSTFDGSYHSIYINNLSQPRALAINPHNETIFWSQMSSSGSGRDICFTRFQGKRSIQCLVTVDQGGVDDLVFDVRYNRLYWSDPSSKQVSYLRIGSFVTTFNLSANYLHTFTVVENVIAAMHPTSLSPVEQPLQFFYARSNQSHLDKRAEVKFLTGPNAFQTLIPSQSQIGDVVLFGDYLQPNKTTACTESNPCQQICISSRVDPICKCAIGYKEDGSKCNSKVLTGPSVFFVDPYLKQIYQISSQPSPLSQSLSSISPQSYSPKVQPVYKGIVDLDSTFAMPHPPVSRPTHFVVDSARGLVHIFDQGHVKTYNPSNQNMETIYPINGKEGTDYQVAQMVFDKIENVIYFTDISNREINKLDVTTKTTNLWKGELEHPFAIAVDSSKRVLYWSEGGGLKSAPLSTPGNVTTYVTLKNITSIAVKEEEGLVYMSDIEEGSIHMLNISKVEVTSIYQSKDLRVFKVIVDDNNLYFVAWNRRAVYMLHRGLNNTADQVEMLSIPVFSRITDIAYVSYFTILPEATNKIPLIVGLTLGILALLLLLLLLLLLFRFCYKKRRTDDPKTNEPAVGMGNASMTTDDDVFSPDDTDSLFRQNREELFYVRNKRLSTLNTGWENRYEQTADAEILSQNTKFQLKDEVGSFPFTTPTETIAPISLSATDLHADNSRKLLLANRGKPATSRSIRNDLIGSFNDLASSVCEQDLPDSEDLRAPPPSNDLLNTKSPACSSSGLSCTSPNQCLPSSDVPPLKPEIGPLTAVGPERGKAEKTGRFVFIPPKLHKQPRGFAPASHSTPAAIKNTFGRLRKTERPGLELGKENGAQNC